MYMQVIKESCGSSRDFTRSTTRGTTKNEAKEVISLLHQNSTNAKLDELQDSIKQFNATNNKQLVLDNIFRLISITKDPIKLEELEERYRVLVESLYQNAK